MPGIESGQSALINDAMLRVGNYSCRLQATSGSVLGTTHGARTLLWDHKTAFLKHWGAKPRSGSSRTAQVSVQAWMSRAIRLGSKAPVRATPVTACRVSAAMPEAKVSLDKEERAVLA